MRYDALVGNERYQVDVKSGDGGWECRVDGAQGAIDVAEISATSLSILLGGRAYTVEMGAAGIIYVGKDAYEVTVTDARSWRSLHRLAGAEGGPQKITASMPGRVVRILADQNARVTPGQGIVVIEAMKMQNEIRSPREGTVKKILVKEGLNVNAGETLAIIE